MGIAVYQMLGNKHFYWDLVKTELIVKKYPTSFLRRVGNDVIKYEADVDLSPDDAVDLSDGGDVDGEQLLVRRKRNAALD